jgi:polar amino acid transport system substrate-binding protein
MRQPLLGLSMVVGMQLAASPFVMAVQAADLDTIRDRGYVIVAVKDNWRPLGYVDDQGNLVGYEIDLARQLALELLGDAEALQLRPVANVDRIPAVLNDEVDVAIAGVSITPMRQRIVQFSLPYYLDGTGFVTRRPTIRTVNDLQRGAIALLQGSAAIPVIQYLFPTVDLVGVASYPQALTALEGGQADAFAGDVTVLAGWVQEHPTYRLLPEVVTAEPLAVVMPKGTQYESLRREVNAAVAEWHDNGWLEDQATAWGLP